MSKKREKYLVDRQTMPSYRLKEFTKIRVSQLATSLKKINVPLITIIAKRNSPYIVPFLGEGQGSELFITISVEEDIQCIVFSPSDYYTTVESGVPTTIAKPANWDGNIYKTRAKQIVNYLNSNIYPKKVALAGEIHFSLWSYLQEELLKNGFETIAGDQFLETIWRTRIDWELNEMFKLAKVLRKVFRYIKQKFNASEIKNNLLYLKNKPLTVGILRSYTLSALAKEGAFLPYGDIFAYGKQAAELHVTLSDDTPIPANTPVIIDLYPQKNLFIDVTRTIWKGHLSKKEDEMYTTTKLALKIAEKEIQTLVKEGKPVSAFSIQEKVIDLLKKRKIQFGNFQNIEEGMLHSLGHGVGYHLHQAPFFIKTSDKTSLIRPGDTFTLEPGIYSFKDGFGIRIENTYYIHPSQLQLINITKFY